MTPRCSLRSPWSRAFLLLFLLLALATAGETQEIHVYKRGKVLGYDKDVGETLHEALIETWSCDSGKLEKTERVETYFHLSEDGEVLTPRALCDRCRERFDLEKRGTKWIFKGLKKAEPKKAEPRKEDPRKEDSGKEAPPPSEGPKPAPPPVAPVDSQAKAKVDQEALEELEHKASQAASEITRIDPREVGSATKRRRIIEDRGLQVAFNEWKDDAKAARAVSHAIEARTDLSTQDRYYVLRSFGWQRYHEHDAKAAAVFYERCIHLIPDWSSAHYGLALVKKDEKDKEGEVVALARALRGKPRLKYARNLVDALKGVKSTAKLDAAATEKLRSSAEDVKQKLEQSPPDQSGAKKACDEIGKLLDERFPLEKKGAGPSEPDEKE